MQLINIKEKKDCAHRVIVGDSAQLPKGLNEDDQEMFSSFLSLEEDFKVLSRINSSVILIKSDPDREKMRLAGSKIRESLSIETNEFSINGNESNVFDILEGFLLSNYQFNKYFKDKEKKDSKIDSIFIRSDFNSDLIDELLNITTAVHWARTMVNEPVSYLTAEKLSQEIEELCKLESVNVTVLEKTQIESLKMGGLLAVNKGSIDPPTFTIVEYKSKDAINKKPIVLVGKGVVYDTGGLSLKPTPNSMDIMKSDMGGAATMVGALYLCAVQKLPLHLITIIPATDNRPGLNAYAPGDVVTMFDGTTVEVLNTDAEGRMILADALAYAKKYDPEVVIDAATLTGAAHRAIGQYATIIMGNADDKYFKELEKSGDECFERVVRFPFWDDYNEELKSPIADLKNLGGPTAGMITAGKFLEHFVTAPYIHMDIAGPAWLDSKKGYRTQGGSGVGVRLLYNFLKNYK